MAAEIEREAQRIGVPPPRPERRCRVCQDPASRDRVNRLLAYGMSAAEIEKSVADLNEARPSNNQITYWSIYTHHRRHFNTQDPAQAAYRRILERRAAEHTDNLQSGVENLLTVYGYLEVVAQKGFENLLAPDTVVGYSKGLEAMVTLHQLTRDGAPEQETAELRRQVGLLQRVVLEEADDETRRRIMARLDELAGPPQALDAEVVEDDEDDEDDEGYSPDTDVDLDDSLED